MTPDDQLPADAFRVLPPAYGAGSLADLLPSVAAGLGVPGCTDVLGLPLDGVTSVAVLLVDGMGTYQLPVASRYAPVLADLAAGGGGFARVLTSGFPSTTPVSLTTLGTGVPPGRHGVVGFTVRLPDGRILNHIRWGDDPDPYTFQPEPTVFERAAAAGVQVTAVTRPEFEGSGLTVASQRGPVFVGAPMRPPSPRACSGRCGVRARPWCTGITPTWTTRVTRPGSTRCRGGRRRAGSTGCSTGSRPTFRRARRCWSPPTTGSSTCRRRRASTSAPTRRWPRAWWRWPGSPGSGTCGPPPGRATTCWPRTARSSATAPGC